MCDTRLPLRIDVLPVLLQICRRNFFTGFRAIPQDLKNHRVVMVALLVFLTQKAREGKRISLSKNPFRLTKTEAPAQGITASGSTISRQCFRGTPASLFSKRCLFISGRSLAKTACSITSFRTKNVPVMATWYICLQDCRLPLLPPLDLLGT